MEEKVARENYITEEGISGQLLLFLLPILFGTFFQQLHGTADAMMMGRFVGEQVLATMGGGTNTPINLLMGFFAGLSSGAMVVISQFYGTRKADKVHRTVHTSIAFSVIGGTIFMTVGLVGSPWALGAMKAPEDVMGHTVVYIRICFLDIVVNPAYNMGTEILWVVGDSRWSLYFLIASCFTDIILDVSLVAVLRMEVVSAALATITPQLSNTILVVHALMKTDDTHKLEWKKVRIDQRMFQRIMRTGIPARMQPVMYNISNVIIQVSINTLGADNVTAWTTYGKVDGLYWMMINALGISTTTLMRRNSGAGRPDRVCKGAGVYMMIGAVLIVSVGAALYNGGRLLVELLTTDLQVQAISMDLLHLMVPTFIIYIAIEILSGTLRGVGDAWVPLVITGIGTCMVKVLRIMLVLPHYHTIIGAAFHYPLVWNLTTVAFAVYCYLFNSLRRWKLKPLKKRFGVYESFRYGGTFYIK